MNDKIVSAEQDQAFCKSKELLTFVQLLVHCDSTKETVLACDASLYGISAVISCIIEDGEKKLIAYTSHILTAAKKKNYTQIDKESLAIVNGVKKFHQMLYGQHFTIVTDQKPFLELLEEMKAIPQLASEQIQRWALIFSTYEYTLRYRKGCDM